MQLSETVPEINERDGTHATHQGMVEVKMSCSQNLLSNPGTAIPGKNVQ
jgi:hypothetical protein